MDLDIQTSEHPGGQLYLLPEYCPVRDKDLETKEASCGIHTGEHFRTTSPDKFAEVCRALAEGMAIKAVARAFGVSRNLVRAVVRRPENVDPLKKEIAGRARLLANMCIERSIEMVADDSAKIPLRDLGIIAGIAIDKSQLLCGEATQRVETIQASSGADDYERQVKELEQADVVELPMGSGGGAAVAKGGQLVAPVVAGAADPVPGSDDDGVPAERSLDCKTSDEG